MVSGTLALLNYLVIYINGKQGSGPNRGRSSVEWGEIPSVCPSIRPSHSGAGRVCSGLFYVFAGYFNN